MERFLFSSWDGLAYRVYLWSLNQSIVTILFRSLNLPSYFFLPLSSRNPLITFCSCVCYTTRCGSRFSLPDMEFNNTRRPFPPYFIALNAMWQPLLNLNQYILTQTCLVTFYRMRSGVCYSPSDCVGHDGLFSIMLVCRIPVSYESSYLLGIDLKVESEVY